MEITFEDVCAVLEGAGLDYDDGAKFRKFPAGPATQLARKIYVLRPRDGAPMRRIDLSGFMVEHPAIRELPEVKRVRGKLGKVVAQVDMSQPRAEILGALVVVAQRIGGARAGVSPTTEHDDDIEVPLNRTVERSELDAWMATRIGYGNVAAKAWFVGMEESCHCADELPERLVGGPVEDLEANLRRLGCYPGLLRAEPTLQPTWRPLIRAWLRATTGKSPSTDEIRRYQRDQLGRRNGDHLLTELLPLPSPSKRLWLYRHLGFERGEYTREWVPKRVTYLGEQWRACRTTPRVALAYGKADWRHFRKIFGLGSQPGEPIVTRSPDWARGFSADGVGVVLTSHPISFGGDDMSWDAVGAWLGNILRTGRGGDAVR